MTKSELCLKCMACCKSLSFEVPFTGLSLEFYKARGVNIISVINKDRTRMFVSIPHTCAQLTSNGCAVYKDRPLSCVVFDGRTSPTVKDVCLWNKEKIDDESDSSNFNEGTARCNKLS